MKKFFMALTVALIFMNVNLSEAADITREQFEKVILDLKTTEFNSKLPLDTETFVERFNWFVVPIVQDALDRDDISDIEHLFVIDDYEILNTDVGTIYSKIFGYPGAMVICMTSGDSEHDLLKMSSFYYTTPESREKSFYTVWLLTAFITSLSIEINAQSLMSDLTAENSSGSVIREGIKFSLVEDGNLNILIATAK